MLLYNIHKFLLDSGTLILELVFYSLIYGLCPTPPRLPLCKVANPVRSCLYSEA